MDDIQRLRVITANNLINLKRAYRAIDTYGDIEVGMLLLRRVLEAIEPKKDEPPCP